MFLCDNFLNILKSPNIMLLKMTFSLTLTNEVLGIYETKPVISDRKFIKLFMADSFSEFMEGMKGQGGCCITTRSE